jgi:N-acyl-L-homoserine lactone synthetase
MELTAKILEPASAEFFQALSLRYRDYLSRGWIAANSIGIDFDEYDKGAAAHIGVFNEEGDCLATQRLICPPEKMMIEGEYGRILDGVSLDFGPSVGEVSRLSVDSKVEKMQFPLDGADFPGRFIHHLLSREIYKYSKEHGIEIIYTATLKEATNAFRSLGFPLTSIRCKKLNNGDIIELVSLSWKEFEEFNVKSCPNRLAWYQKYQS